MSKKANPRNFRYGHDGSLACSHRDVTCCPACASKHPEIIDVHGRHFWIADPAHRSAMLAEMKKGQRNKVCKAEVPTEVKASEPVKAKAKKTRATKLADDLSIPPFLDRIEGRSKEEIEAERDRLIEQDKKRDQAQRKIIATKPKESPNLNDADRKAIAELKADADAKAKAKKEAGLEALKKLNAEKKAQKAEAVAIKQAAKEANGKPEPAKSEPKKSAKGKANAKSEPKKSVRGKAKTTTGEKGDALFGMLKRKNGASNAEMMTELGFRRTVGAMKKLCKERGYKLNIKREEGEPMRYVATN